MRKKHQTSRQKKIPRHLQQKIGEATNLYTFGRFDEAIPIFESVIKEMPDLADVTHTMSLIYEEKGDLEKAFTFCFLSAIETRTDSDKWQQCARLALGIQNHSHAIYCFNRAIKALDPVSQYKQVFDLKMQKIDVYSQKGDFVSILRTVEKMIAFYKDHLSCPEKKEIEQMLRKIQYETLFRQGNALKACQIIYSNFIESSSADTGNLI